jgi:hypothetical protein
LNLLCVLPSLLLLLLLLLDAQLLRSMLVSLFGRHLLAELPAQA